MSGGGVSWWRTTFGEAEAQGVRRAIEAEHISQGPVTAAFERGLSEVLDGAHVAATTSGSVALLMAMLAVGVGPGDEVIVPNRTWIATAHAARLLGGAVVLVDVEAERPVLDVTRLGAGITPPTQAVVAVHLNGRAPGMATIGRIARRHGVAVVEDAAQALCSHGPQGPLGTLSDVGCFSLSVAKIISTGQGGFVATKDAALHERLRLMRSHGVSDVVNATYTELGFNFRFTDIQASMGLAQLARLPGRVERVRALYARYAAALGEFPFLKLIPVDVAMGELPLYVEVLCPERESLVAFLAARGIQTRPFYPDLDTAAHLAARGDFPNSRVFGEQGLFLPSGPEQPPANIDRVFEALRDYGKQR